MQRNRKASLSATDALHAWRPPPRQAAPWAGRLIAPRAARNRRCEAHSRTWPSGRNAPFWAALRPPRRVPLRQGRQGHSHPSLAPPRQPCRSGSVPSRALRRQPGPASRRAYLPVPRLVPPPVPRRPSPRAAQRRTIQNQGLAAAKLRRARLSSHLGRLLHWLLRLLRHLEARRRLVVDLPRQPQS